MSIKEFKLPDPGEGLTEAEIVSWKVKPGDTVKVNDIVVEIETAKSLVELPVPFAGVVESLLAEEGATVEVGTAIIAIQTDASASGQNSPQVAPGQNSPQVAPGQNSPQVAPPADLSAGRHAAGTEEEDIEEGKIGGTTSTGRTAVLVGYGVKQTDAKRRPRKVDAPDLNAKGTDVAIEPIELGGDEAVSAASADAVSPRGNLDEGFVRRATSIAPSQARTLAKPPVRKLAKDLGIDLGTVAGSGADGIVTRADVEAHAASPGSADGAPSAAADSPAYSGGLAATGPGMPFAAGSRGESRTPIKGVRKVTAKAMVDSAFTAPHVTEWVTCDVSATVDLVERLKQDKEFRDVKVTPLLVLAKAMCIAARRHPGINVSWDEAAQEIVTKHYVNLGIAAATPRGLMVPNIKDADTLPLLDLARAIGELTGTAREGRTQPADMAGGTITITNVGVFGVDTGTPILNPGEAAIVALGAVRRMPWVVTAADGNEAIEARWVTQLGMSFDHRLVDGELGSKYLADVAAILSDPTCALVWA